MKIVHQIVAAAISSLVLTFAAGAYAQSTPGYATIVRIQGQARYTIDGSRWHPLVVGQTLAAGAVIQTSADSKVDLVLGRKVGMHINTSPDRIADAADVNVRGLVSFKAVARQNVIRMYGNTVLAVDKLTASDTGVDAMGNTELDLRQGSIFGSVKKLSAASEFLIKMPNGVAGVRGTIFYLSADGSLTVSGGSVVISINGGAPITVNDGDQFNPTTGTVTPLSGTELLEAQTTATTVTSEISTVVENIYAYAPNITTVYVSPVRGEK